MSEIINYQRNETIKVRKRTKRLIDKIEKVIDKKILFNNEDTKISFKIKDGDIVSFSIRNLRHFKVDGGESDIYTDYFDYFFIHSQKDLFLYLENIYNSEK